MPTMRLMTIHDNIGMKNSGCEACMGWLTERRTSLGWTHSLRAHSGEIGAQAHRAQEIVRLYCFRVNPIDPGPITRAIRPGSCMALFTLELGKSAYRLDFAVPGHTSTSMGCITPVPPVSPGSPDIGA